MALDAAQLKEAATELLLEEADTIDQRRWDDWLALFEEDATYYAPAWEGDDDLTSDPHQEISLIFCGNRERMWDRVWRIKSNLSSSLARMPRTCHLVTNIRVSDVSNSALKATANFRTETFKHEEKDSTAFFGRYLYDLKRTGDQLTIQNKKIIVYNDIIPRQMDIFNI
ncbi:MAG: aromatic-ring-hydroxylating dioxygenase subunit beta [Immundisolibacteraceae bacterium]|nr:ring-hydroxylating dioxygenase beta subunit [uncultured bacterium]MDF1819612.1 aromatic-ring-hydroxylating dioxygenase subunit beta [Immundisolibacteraceae bacterium]